MWPWPQLTFYTRTIFIIGTVWIYHIMFSYLNKILTICNTINSLVLSYITDKDIRCDARVYKYYISLDYIYLDPMRKLYRVFYCISFNYTTGESCTAFPPVSVLIIQLEEVVQSFQCCTTSSSCIIKTDTGGNAVQLPPVV
jgi:hypothetical protein